jgi:beta-glucosidase/6-phospho-beta-glucosidase/beta-galactosidase
VGDLHVHCGFHSFFLGGFECSAHRRRNGERLDLIASTAHDRYIEQDYKRLISMGMRTCRDGVRWHLIERRPYRYDFSSLHPMLLAARHAGMQVIWDLCHYGWPDDLDLLDPEFIPRFVSFARAAAIVIAQETDGPPYIAPINEISFFSWATSEFGCIFPALEGRGAETKAQLVRASIAAIAAIRDEAPNARFVQVDPLINVVSREDSTEADRREAAAYTHAQFQGWDMLAGMHRPELGGSPDYIDIVGANYYVHNQWELDGVFIERTDPRYRPLREMLAELYRRYRRPLFIAETGIEDERRPEWFSYVCDEVMAAIRSGIPVEGICLYPVVNHPGWEDDRHCHNGLWDYCNDCGHREIYRPLANELLRQQGRFQSVHAQQARTAKTAEVYI